MWYLIVSIPDLCTLTYFEFGEKTMCVLRDHFSAIICQLLNHYPRSIHEATSFKSFKISLFTRYLYLCPTLQREITRKIQRAIIKKNNIFFKSSLGYLLIILVCSKLLAVRVFEILSFLCSNLQRAMTEFLFKFSPGNLLISSIS